MGHVAIHAPKQPFCTLHALLYEFNIDQPSAPSEGGASSFVTSLLSLTSPQGTQHACRDLHILLVPDHVTQRVRGVHAWRQLSGDRLFDMI